MNNKSKLSASLKERWRKFLVSLKRKPSIIPMIFLILGFLIFSLNVAPLSNVTDKINMAPMGLMAFTTFLLSILSFVCLLNAFPRRQPTKKIILLVLFVFIAIIIACDIKYYSNILDRLNNTTMNKPGKELMRDIVTVQGVLIVHIIVEAITMIVLALLPIFAKLLKKINTSIEVEGNSDNIKIDITDAD